MHCDLNYGRGVLPVELGEELDVHVLRKPAMPILHDPHDAVCEAFAKPINSAPLTELARHVRSAAIAICDITRPVPNRLFLRPLIETLTGGRRSAEENHCFDCDGPSPTQSRCGAGRVDW